MAAAEDPVDGAGPAASTRARSSASDADGRFRTAYDQHLTEIWRFVRRRCDGPDDADDVTADVFAVAWRRRQNLPPEDEVRLWLYGVARGILANQHRSVRRRRRLHLRAVDAAATGPSGAPDPADDPAGSALWAALATLDADDRELLLLRSWDGLAVTELAVLLDRTPNAVSLRLRKARRRLATALDPATNDETRTDPPRPRTSKRRSPNSEGDAR